MRNWLTIVVLSLLCITCVMGQPKVDEYSESGDCLAISEAVTYTTDGVKKLRLFSDLKGARELLERAIESDSTYAPAHYTLAQMQMYKSADSAYIHARNAYKYDTANTWYLSSYAQSAAMLERFDEAQLLYEKLILLQPRDINAYRILAILHNQQKRPMEAVRLLDSAEVKVGRNPYLVNLKRQILLSNNQVDMVVNDARNRVAQEPYSIEGRIELAELYRDLKRDSLALVEYNAALAIDSMKLETLVSMGDFLQEKGDNVGYIALLKQILKSGEIDEAGKIQLVQEMIDNKELYRREYISIGSLITSLIIQYPNNDLIVEMQSRHLIAMGMLDEALMLLKNHLDVEPPSLKTYRTVIDIERFKERIDSVEFYLNRAMVKFPEEQDLKYEWAFTLSSQKRYDEAIELYEGYLSGASDSLSSSMWGIIGDLHHQVALENKDNKKIFKQRVKQSYRAYDNALKYSPDNAMVLNNYAYFVCEYGGDLNKALDMAERATALFEGNPTFIDTYAWILYRLGRYEDAKVNMRRAISFDTTQNGEIALHFGEILAVLGESTLANHYWGKALEWGMTEEQVDMSRRAAAETLKKQDKGDKKSEE
ncbi:MAG: hypothetical protein SNG10_05025 [Rikenellaceae bacterium]